LERDAINNSDAKAPRTPATLSLPDNPLAALCEAIETLDDRNGFFETIAEAAEKSGCEFLFEVPGALFGTTGARAAAIRCAKNSTIGDFFILYDRKNGNIRILSGDEVSGEVSGFVRSYAIVLQCLQGSGKSRRIH